MIEKEIINEYFKIKKYLHFDRRVKFETVEAYVTNPKKIMLHSFLPFIHYVDVSEKFTNEANAKKNNRPVKEKKRNIMYAGHLDGYIYKYYSVLLNEYYSYWATKYGIGQCSIAYRDNKFEKSNIDFAAEVINQIVDYNNSYILVGDFTNFFDDIDHQILKHNLIKVMCDFGLLEESKLSKDWYNIFRSITKFGYYNKSLINEFCGSDQELWNNKQQRYFNTIQDLRIFQKKHKIEYNKNCFGIPQGTAISGIFANIYAINFDLRLNQIASRYGGLYRRYSDDFILVIPKIQKTNIDLDLASFIDIEKEVQKIAQENKILLQEEKTGKYEYNDSKVVNLDTQKYSHIDYLGFVFNGKTVLMRGKSPYKFYRKAYDLIKRAKRIKNKKELKKIPYRKQLYTLYTDLGSELKPYGNFISYAKRSQRKFDKISPKTNNMMLHQIKNRKKKIEKNLGIKLHVRV